MPNFVVKYGITSFLFVAKLNLFTELSKFTQIYLAMSVKMYIFAYEKIGFGKYRIFL